MQGRGAEAKERSEGSRDGSGCTAEAPCLVSWLAAECTLPPSAPLRLHGPMSFVTTHTVFREWVSGGNGGGRVITHPGPRGTDGVRPSGDRAYRRRGQETRMPLTSPLV